VEVWQLETRHLVGQIPAEQILVDEKPEDQVFPATIGGLETHPTCARLGRGSDPWQRFTLEEI
jgi:hypothetical protein